MVTCSFGASNFLSGITSTYTAMFSADLMPCTLTLPLISLARLAHAKIKIRPDATAAFAAILDRFMTYLSYLSFSRGSIIQFQMPLEDVINSRLERVRAEEQSG